MARYEIFTDTYKSKTEVNPLQIKKTLNSSVYPPRKSILIEKIKRTNQIAAIWANATENSPTFYHPSENEWNFVNEKFKIKWFEGPQLPQYLEDILSLPQDTETESNEEYYLSGDNECLEI